MDLNFLFESCNQALDEGNCTLAYSFLEKAYPLLLNYPPKNIAWAQYYYNCAVVFNNSGSFERCHSFAHQASVVAQQIKNDYLKAKIESLYATSYLNIGNFSESFKHADYALKLFNRLKRKEDIAETLMILGEIYFRRENWEIAIRNYSEALFFAKKLKNKRIEGKALMALGYVFRAHRFLYLAVDHYREAEKIYKSINFTQGLVTALYERANTYLSLRKPEMTDKIMKEIESLTPSDSPMRMFLLKLQYCIHNQNQSFSDAMVVITSYSIHYTKLYEARPDADSEGAH